MQLYLMLVFLFSPLYPRLLTFRYPQYVRRYDVRGCSCGGASTRIRAVPGIAGVLLRENEGGGGPGTPCQDVIDNWRRVKSVVP